MLFLFRIFSSEPWKWEPEFIPDIPLARWLIWGGRALLVYIALAIAFPDPLLTLSLLAFALACWLAWTFFVKG
ncbi:MAG: hypothetical protein DI628_04095 [Blastochloris viridis]|uniref:Uncharacterized protein n=1 Tax=Blastochloris viridis TaxID=1079 RepID=A0A6N4RDI8_BLAVI|nr:MAG: hypothetical protein DI628_04095 [Blastochloris viridis]